jgi:hypothetical protein
MKAPTRKKITIITRRGLFTDIKDIKGEMLTGLEVHFEKWL